MAQSGASNWIRLDTIGSALSTYTISVEMTNEEGADVSVEFTVDRDLDTTPQAITHNVLNRITKSTASHMLGPMAAIRLNVISYRAGTITLKVLQA